MEEIDRAVCYYIAKDMLPLDTVSGEGFLHMIKEFEPRYNPPGRKALTTNYYQICTGENWTVLRLHSVT